MMSAKFDLRGWRFNEVISTFHRTGEESSAHEENVSVLGLEWNSEDDILRCAYKQDVFDAIPLIKRSILSSANQLFDPLGILSSVTLKFKILMQDCWGAKLSWDAELSDELAKKFLKLKSDLTYVDNLTFPRRLAVSEGRLRNLSPFFDPKGLIRIKAQLLMRKDFENFKYPILLPPDHIAVHKMIMHRHQTLSHCGIHTLMSSRLYPLEVSSPIDRNLRKRIEDPVICDEGKDHNPSDSSSPVPVSQEESAPVPVSQEESAPVPVSQEEILPTSQPWRINRYGRTLRAPHRLDL
ncbi:hypothetical protein HNY73_021271 [Argiope bruennichi]|uniref:Uncharacterized protein n=1 Tax=Argiope bruennichi TaxID=94029 RepID=A0A8T0E9M2_ARGBR|nr:hypothetical protein HNY73_021271 [Argiope bruennichi]